MNCPSCGVKLPVEASFCPNCGTTISTDQPFRDEPFIMYAGSQPQGVPPNTAQPGGVPSLHPPLYPPYPYPMPPQVGYPPPVPQLAPPPARKRRTGLTIGIVILLFVLISASGCVYYGLALRNLMTTAQNGIIAQATVDSASPTPITDDTTPTPTVPLSTQPNPYTPFTGNVVLDDPMSDNSQGNQWVEGSATGSCQFTGNAYHVTIPGTANPITESCPANNTNFSNFAFQVEMTIIKGSTGGITFRNLTRSQFYYFYITVNSRYSLALFSPSTTNQPVVKTLQSGFSSAIHTLPGQSNLLAVVAHGNTIDLYANKTRVSSVVDATYTSGRIGVAAHITASSHVDTDVMFKNARVWQF